MVLSVPSYGHAHKNPDSPPFCRALGAILAAPGCHSLCRRQARTKAASPRDRLARPCSHVRCPASGAGHKGGLARRRRHGPWCFYHLSCGGDHEPRPPASTVLSTCFCATCTAMDLDVLIPTKPPPVSEIIAPPDSEMMSPPGSGALSAMIVVVSFGAYVKRSGWFSHAACYRHRGRADGRCGRGDRGSRRHRSDPRSPDANWRWAAGW